MSKSYNKTFTAQVKKFVKIAKDRQDEAVRKIGLSLLANVVGGSPVDTGRFRGNWQIGLGVRPSSSLDVQEKDSDSVVQRESSKLKDFKAGTDLFITNTLPYARRLEFGWSQQAPSGMVRVTMKNIKQIVEGAIS